MCLDILGQFFFSFKKSDFYFELRIHLTTPAKYPSSVWEVVSALGSGCLRSILGTAVHRLIYNTVSGLLSEQQTPCSGWENHKVEELNRGWFWRRH